MAINWYQLAVDFQQKYERTYVRVKLEGRKNLSLCLVKAVVGNKSGPPEVHLYNPEDGNIVLLYVTNSEMYFDYPNVGFFFHNNAAWFCFRRMDRRWTRGLSEHTVYVGNPYFRFNQYLTEPFDFPLIESMYRAFETHTLEEATALLKNEFCISIPLSREFALGQDVRAGKGTYLLWYHDNPIAEVTPYGVLIKESNFKQEIEDYLRRTHQSIYVN